MEKQWFIIRTKPHKEFVASTNYQNQGYHCYVPSILKTVTHAREKSAVVRAFFPGYLFLHLTDEEQDWAAISSTIGSLCPVKFGDRYPVVPDEIIAALRARESDDGYISLLNIRSIKEGQSVRVISGELEGLTGLFMTAKGADRALVLLDMLQRQVKSTVPIDLLEVV
nr:transcriptional activator RfaH [Desulfobulbaceae bacterium]